MRIIIKLFLVIVVVVTATCAFGAKKTSGSSSIELELPTRADVSQRYGNLDYGVRIQVNSDVRNRDILNTSDLPSKEAAEFPAFNMVYSLTESA